MIIESLLDTDLYKTTMQEVVWNHFPNVQVEYAFHCRTRGVDLSPYADEIREALDAYCRLRLTDDEATYLKSIRKNVSQNASVGSSSCQRRNQNKAQASLTLAR